MPDSISRCGLLIAPPQSNTSRVAVTVCSAPLWRKVTPVARSPEISILVANAPVATVRFDRDRAGLR
jgi:hypothetical protein